MSITDVESNGCGLTVSIFDSVNILVEVSTSFEFGRRRQLPDSVTEYRVLLGFHGPPGLPSDFRFSGCHWLERITSYRVLLDLDSIDLDFMGLNLGNLHASMESFPNDSAATNRRTRFQTPIRLQRCCIERGLSDWWISLGIRHFFFFSFCRFQFFLSNSIGFESHLDLIGIRWPSMLIGSDVGVGS